MPTTVIRCFQTCNNKTERICMQNDHLKLELFLISGNKSASKLFSPLNYNLKLNQQYKHKIHKIAILEG